jgi:hypothetical protein
MVPLRVIAVIGMLLVAACGGGGQTGGDATITDAGSAAGGPSASASGEQRYPHIVGVEITPADQNTFDLTVTVSSPYDSPDRYADGWRVLAPDGTELATHTLLHDHAGEQPFTRTQAGVDIPADIDEVIVEGRDQRYGYGGSTAIVAVPHDAR